MAILSGPEIIKQRAAGNIVIEPFDPKLVGPNSVDVHLGKELLVYDRTRQIHPGLVTDAVMDSRDPPPTKHHTERPQGGWILQPGKLYLGATAEYTSTIGFVPYIDGRSSMGRLGLFCHVTAGRGDNGFKGCWTLELAVIEPLIIYPGQRIAQLTYHTIEGAMTFYGNTANSSGRYQGDRHPSPIKLDK